MGIRELAFYPTLFYNLVRNKISRQWDWYNRIDDTVILGALPFKSMIDQLVTEEKVGGVVCLNEAHEMDHSWVAGKADWERAGVSFYWLPVPDFFHSASATDIVHAVKFIRGFEESGQSVYVHCKAGRTRSATVVGCYLMQRHHWYPNVAMNFISRRRPHVTLRPAHNRAMNEFTALIRDKESAM